MARIVDFLEKLASDPDLEARYDDDPDGVMTEEGLSDEQRRLIREAPIAQVREAVRKELPEGSDAYMIKRIVIKGSPPAT
jgi:hypothetical protein